jgi:uncharacterized MAPEG superfamily protein
MSGYATSVSVTGWGRCFYSGKLFLVSTMFYFLLYIVRTNILFSLLWAQVFTLVIFLSTVLNLVL